MKFHKIYVSIPLLSILFFSHTNAQEKKYRQGDDWRKKAFTWIYENHHWCPQEGAPVSGAGSTLESTETLRTMLPAVIDILQIKTVLDAGCGDFTWMQTLNLDIAHYIGCDIVEELIQVNTSKFTNEQTSFFCKDVVKDAIPKVDLIICRDCLAHLSLEDITGALKNFKKSGSTYLLASTFPKIKINSRMESGNFRGVNLRAYPYNLPEPIIFFEELSAEKDMKRWGKCMAVWRIADIDV